MFKGADKALIKEVLRTAVVKLAKTLAAMLLIILALNTAIGLMECGPWGVGALLAIVLFGVYCKREYDRQMALREFRDRWSFMSRYEKDRAIEKHGEFLRQLGP